MPLSCENPKINSPKRYVVDIFSGAGGSSLGFINAGFQILGAIELDPYATETYQKNFEVSVKALNIRDLDPKEYRIELGLEKCELDVLMGCPPCQGFSRMRNSEGEGDYRNDLVIHYLKFVKEFLPRFAIFENVPGIIKSSHGKKYYEELTSSFKDLGYELIEKLENAADFGVPQIRKRVIVIGGRDGEVPPFPQRTHGDPTLPDAKDSLLSPWKTVKDAIGNGNYPSLKAGENGESDGKYPNHIASRIGNKVLEFIKKVPKDGGSRKDVSKEHWLTCHKNHDGHADVYGRLAWDRPANTITTGCTNISKGRFVHPVQNRALTYREAAALQGFPGDFIFWGKKISTQIGNAVPPPLAHAIAKVLIDRIESDNNDKCS